jgi:hypothetical protein
MISCLVVLAAQLGCVPAELSALGKVSEFVDLTQGDDAMVSATTYISNSGNRIYRMPLNSPLYLYTWKIGALDPVLKTYGAAGYDTKAHRPFMAWQFGSSVEIQGPTWGFAHQRLVGLSGGHRPLIWQSGYGTNGFLSSSLGWIDVERKGRSSAKLLYFERKQYDFVSYDDSRKQLFVRDTKQKLRLFKLGKDYRSTREVVLTEKQQREHDAKGGVRSGRWEAYAEPGFVLKERDLTTGKSWTVSNDPDRKHYVEYAGDDLFTLESLTPSRSVLNLWDRRARRLKRIGPYGIFASSPNGQFIVFSARGGNLWLVDRYGRRGGSRGKGR